MVRNYTELQTTPGKKKRNARLRAKLWVQLPFSFTSNKLGGTLFQSAFQSLGLELLAIEQGHRPEAMLPDTRRPGKSGWADPMDPSKELCLAETQTHAEPREVH